MSTDEKRPSSERAQTDESLRVERARSDDAIGDKLESIEDTADAVINQARERADAVLAAARAKTDREARASVAPGSPTHGIIKKERAVEDRALRDERAYADATLRVERAESAALLASEREETDKDLKTERERADASLATRDEFLGVVSHDLRSMLSSVVGYAALIAREAEREKYVGQSLSYAQRIQRSGARMSRLIGDLVDVASIEAGALAVTREVGDPSQVVAEVVENFQAQAAASGVSLSAEVASPLPLISFDPARVLQVLTNLVSNAIKFTPASGTVAVRVGPVGDELRFAVTDTGRGIPIDKLEAVFERFLQLDRSDRRGVGLGLYISKCIVLGHGGRIWAESKLGEGSTVFFTIAVHVEE